jgi:hypothetical protein
MTVSQPVSYSGWQSETTGFMGRLSGPGFGMVAAAALIATLPFNVGWQSAFLCLPLSLFLLALAFGRVMGLSADEWISLAVRHQISVATRRNLFFSGAFAPRSAATGRQPMDLPGTLARLRILDAPDGLGGQLGVVHDPVAGTYSAIARITFPGLALVDTDQQAARVAAWAAFLRTYCTEDSPLTRIAVHQRCLPDDGAALAGWTARHISADAPDAAVTVLSELMDSAGPAATAPRDVPDGHPVRVPNPLGREGRGRRADRCRRRPRTRTPRDGTSPFHGQPPGRGVAVAAHGRPDRADRL